MPHRILSAGIDEFVLSSRNAVLQQAGYEIRALTDLPSLPVVLRAEGADLVILGSSVEFSAKINLAAELRREFPNVPVLVICAQYEPLPPQIEGVAFMQNLEGPNHLLRTISDLLSPDRKHAHGA